jgi:DNA topoisomerase-3
VKKDHTNPFFRERTKPPTIYRSYFITAMETAGKQIDDEDLRNFNEGKRYRTSTRANIIETLFRRQYIIRNKETSITYLNRDSTD